MAESELNIILKATDNASATLKGAINGAKDEVNKLGNESTKSKDKMKSFGQEMKEAGKQLKDLRRTAFIATAALAVMIKSVGDAAQYNQEAKVTFDKFTASIKSLSTSIGLTLQPALEGVTSLVNILRDAINAVVAGFIKMFALIWESFGALGTGLKAIGDNIKSFFTGDDPIGVVEAFKTSFQRAMDIANASADEFLNKVETTRAKVEGGKTLDVEKKEAEDLGKIVVMAQKKIKSGWEGVAESVELLGASLDGASEMGKGFARAAASIAMAMAIINTAQGVTKALADYKWPFSMVVAGIVAAAGAIQIATIAAQKFHSGGMIKGGLSSDEVPIIAQTGEGILSRQGMSALGGENNLNKLNRGETSLTNDVNINVYYPKFNQREDMNDLIGLLGIEIQKQLRYARAV